MSQNDIKVIRTSYNWHLLKQGTVLFSGVGRGHKEWKSQHRFAHSSSRPCSLAPALVQPGPSLPASWGGSLSFQAECGWDCPTSLSTSLSWLTDLEVLPLAELSHHISLFLLPDHWPMVGWRTLKQALQIPTIQSQQTLPAGQSRVLTTQMLSADPACRPIEGPRHPDAHNSSCEIHFSLVLSLSFLSVMQRDRQTRSPSTPPTSGDPYVFMQTFLPLLPKKGPEYDTGVHNSLPENISSCLWWLHLRLPYLSSARFISLYPGFCFLPHTPSLGNFTNSHEFIQKTH